MKRRIADKMVIAATSFPLSFPDYLISSTPKDSPTGIGSAEEI